MPLPFLLFFRFARQAACCPVFRKTLFCPHEKNWFQSQPPKCSIVYSETNCQLFIKQFYLYVFIQEFEQRRLKFYFLFRAICFQNYRLTLQPSCKRVLDLCFFSCKMEIWTRSGTAGGFYLEYQLIGSGCP